MSRHPAEPEVRALGRRRFLKAALWAAAAGAVALGGGFAWLSRSRKDAQPKPDGIGALDDAEYHLFAAVAAASLPAPGNAAGLLPWNALPILANVDHLIAGVPTHARGDVAAALKLLDYSTVPTHGRRFVDLSVDEARAVLLAWNRGGEVKRAVSNLVRKLVYVAYWRESATWSAIDFDGPVTVKWGLPKLGNAPLPGVV
ncbi:MAG: twin-arginine translocation signal domain-containing protein [Pseudomonadota bacterium]